MSKDARFTMRMSHELKDRLQAIADREKRSLAKQIDKVLWDFVEAQGK